MARKTRRNVLTDYESIRQICPENARLVSDFLHYLVSVQRSESTVAVYESDLNICMVWCLKHIDNKPFPNWTKRDIISLQNWLVNENGNSPARVRRIKAVLSSMSKYIEDVCDEDYPNFRNIINRIESPANQPVREKTVWTDEELKDLLDKLMERREYKKACGLALAVYGGRRKSELSRFRVCDFDEKNLVCDGALYKTSTPIRTKGRGKGKFLYCYTLAKNFRPYLEAWLEERERLGIESEWLLPDPTDSNKQLSVSSLNSWANTFSRLSGRDVYWHSFRHSYVTSLVRAGIPDSVIAQIIGWDSVEMCKIYNDMEAEEHIAMYFKNGDIDVSRRKSFDEI